MGKSYISSDVVNTFLSELAQDNNLPESTVIELLIRQAQAAKWLVTTLPAPVDDLGVAPIYLATLPFTAPTQKRLATACIPSKPGQPLGYLTTLQEVACFGGHKLLKKCRLGKKALPEITVMCEKYGLYLSQ